MKNSDLEVYRNVRKIVLSSENESSCESETNNPPRPLLYPSCTRTEKPQRQTVSDIKILKPRHEPRLLGDPPALLFPWQEKEMTAAEKRRATDKQWRKNIWTVEVQNVNRTWSQTK